MRIFFFLIALIIVGCSSSPSPVLPPVSLPDFEPTASMVTEWRSDVGRGARYFYLRYKPVFDGDTGYMADYEGTIYAFDVKTGDQLWQRDLNLKLTSGLSLEEGHLLLGSNLGDVIALDPKDGHELWRSKVSSEVLTPPLARQGFVVVRTIDGHLYALDANNGKRRWIFESSVPLLTLRGNSAPLIVNDMVLMGSDNGKLTALTLKDGIELWETAIAVPAGRTELERIIDIDVDLIVVDDLIYAATYQGRLAAVQLENGRIRWVQDMSSYAGMTADAYRIYITDAESQVLALNRMSGAILWRQEKLLRRQLTGPALHGDNVVVADYDGYVHWLDREDGHIVNRILLNEVAYQFDEEWQQDDTDYYDRERNILANPVVYQDMLIVNDRFGIMSAYSYSDS
ncbi:Outer membrane beta-barrel assembly protein BamB [hydrothermal vent metagenome]|uniref:Outer membrane beta-barrel assembly protein BamB n=1 Tax=hydrothermal vent metagenome TaxID=652676 RepID=A0A3B1ARF0_9ZZZZ